jgi:hypothetical protein
MLSALAGTGFNLQSLRYFCRSSLQPQRVKGLVDMNFVNWDSLPVLVKCLTPLEVYAVDITTK